MLLDKSGGTAGVEIPSFLQDHIKEWFEKELESSKVENGEIWRKWDLHNLKIQVKVYSGMWDQAMKMNVTSEQTTRCASWRDRLRKARYPLCSLLAENRDPCFDHEKISNQNQNEEFFKEGLRKTILLKNINVKKKKGGKKLWKYSREKGTWDRWQLDMIHDLEWMLY